MIKKFFLLLLLISTVASGQGQTQTAKVPMTSFGSQVGFVPVNTGSVLDVLNSPYGGLNCAMAPLAGLPQVYASGGADSYFNSGLVNWSYPTDVAITRITMKVCYAVFGYVYEPLAIRPVYRNKITGVVYEGPVLAAIAGPNPGSLFSALLYAYFPSSAATSATVNWTFATTGAPNISSLALANGNIEVGFRVNRNPTFNGPQWFPYTNAVKIYSTDTRYFVTVGAGVPNISPPILSYTSGSTFSAGLVTVQQLMPTNPSEGSGVRLSVRCTDGVYRNLGSAINFPWGIGAGFKSLSYSIATLNTNACQSSPIVAGSSLTIRSQPIRNGTLIGTAVSSSVFVF